MSKNTESKESDNFLLYVPQKKHDLYEVKQGKVYLIFHHDKPLEKFTRWLVKKPSVSDLELDELGSEVWLLIDGQKTIYDIGQELYNKFGSKCEPIYDRLILYIRYLNRRGWISFKNDK